MSYVLVLRQSAMALVSLLPQWWRPETQATVALQPNIHILPRGQLGALLVGHCAAVKVSTHLPVAKMLVVPIAVQNQAELYQTEAPRFAASNEHALRKASRV